MAVNCATASSRLARTPVMLGPRTSLLVSRKPWMLRAVSSNTLWRALITTSVRMGMWETVWEAWMDGAARPSRAREGWRQGRSDQAWRMFHLRERGRGSEESGTATGEEITAIDWKRVASV